LVAWGKLQEALKEIQKTGTSDEKQSEMLFSKLIEVLPDLIKKSPEVELTRLSLKTENGEVVGKAKVTIDGTNPELINNPFFLLTAINAEADLTIPRAFLESILEGFARKNLMAGVKGETEETPDDEEINELAKSEATLQIKHLLEQNILVVQANDLKLRATYKQGQLKLNGQPTELPLSE